MELTGEWVFSPNQTESATDLGDWIEILSGEKERLRHGYFVTKQPDLKSNLSFDEARAQETDFLSKAPWSELRSQLRSRVGTRHLTQALSRLLSDLI
jgi:Dynamin central region